MGLRADKQRQQEKKRFDEARPLIQFLLQVNTFEHVNIKFKKIIILLSFMRHIFQLKKQKNKDGV